jgi:hypothetical protein
MVMRDLKTLIGVVRQFIPSTEKDVHADLQRIQEFLPFTPPECIGEKWQDAARILTQLGEPVEGGFLWLRIVGIIWLGLKAEDSKLW